MGGREVGSLANLWFAHRDLANPAHRAEVAALWGMDDVPATPGNTAIDMFEAVRIGDIKVLWLVPIPRSQCPSGRWYARHWKKPSW
jgi:assimilatory nitrate reductase catalytic subunit